MSGLEFNETEALANDQLMEVMTLIIHGWGLQYNHDELTRAIHTIQLFIWQHALQRTAAACGDWFLNV